MKYTYFKETVAHNTDERPFSLHHTETVPGSDLVLYKHWHNEIEFFYLEEGNTFFCIEDVNFHVSKGDAILIPPNLLHWAEKVNNEPCSFYAVVFHSDLFINSGGYLFRRFIQPLFFNGKAYALKLSVNSPWENSSLKLLKELLLYYNAPDINIWELEFYGLLCQLWNKIYVNHFMKLKDIQSYQHLSDKLSNSMEYICENYENNITIKQLSKKANLSIGTFCRYFKQLNGLTPMNYILRYRIIKSCDLLINSDMKITDIALKCGFNNISYFNREFRQYIKCTPSEYRKQV